MRTPVAAVAVALLLAVACGRDPSTPGGASASGAASSPEGHALAPTGLPEAALAPLRAALSAYEECRELLVADSLEGLPERASRLVRGLELAGEALPADASHALARSLEEAAVAAQSMGEARDLASARAAFGEVSRFLIAIGAADARLAEGMHVFECPMTETFPKWMQPSEEIENPYMGASMPSCGVPADWTAPAPETLDEIEAHAEAAHGGDIAFYTCSMHPSVKSEEPGTCPICSMDLVPVTEEEVATGIIRMDAARRQTIGVETARAARRPLSVSVRAAGTVTFDETRLRDVSLKVGGYIGRLEADETGQLVERGQTLFTLYSPALLATQEELLGALASQRAASATDAPHRADYLVEAARRRLRLWDLEERQIDEVIRSGEPVEYLPIVSPVTGYVIEKNVVEGAAVEPGMRLYRIAGLDTVWIEAEIDEQDLPLVAVGQQATITLPSAPGRTFEGRVDSVVPYLEGRTRTGRVRVRLRNPDLALKPAMYATVVLRRELGERLVVPEEAVLYAGERSFVFLDLGDGRLDPTAVETGLRSRDEVEILSGVREGDAVVTSGNFLVAAESRLKLAMEHWR